MTRGLVWVTRTDPFNRLTAKRLAGAGYTPLSAPALRIVAAPAPPLTAVPDALVFTSLNGVRLHRFSPALAGLPVFAVGDHSARYARAQGYRRVRSEEHTSELQSLMRISYAVFCLKKKKQHQ